MLIKKSNRVISFPSSIKPSKTSMIRNAFAAIVTKWQNLQDRVGGYSQIKSETQVSSYNFLRKSWSFLLSIYEDRPAIQLYSIE